NWLSFSTADSNKKPVVYVLDCDGEKLKAGHFQGLINRRMAQPLPIADKGTIFVLRPDNTSFVLVLGENCMFFIEQGQKTVTRFMSPEEMQRDPRVRNIFSSCRTVDNFVRNKAAGRVYEGQGVVDFINGQLLNHRTKAGFVDDVRVPNNPLRPIMQAGDKQK
ncbi:hypothetical protein HZA87_06160, partial [Candidatus Uhrbacteria bacterium]|nr:hypothetical protein [Candidatus Uhrbacteria bacterium]